MIETLDDILETLADQLGIYGAHSETCKPDKLCRVCWTAGLNGHILQAVDVDRKLAAPAFESFETELNYEDREAHYAALARRDADAMMPNKPPADPRQEAMEALWQDVAGATPETEDERLRYVSVQIDRKTWLEVQRIAALEKEPRDAR